MTLDEAIARLDEEYGTSDSEQADAAARRVAGLQN